MLDFIIYALIGVVCLAIVLWFLVKRGNSLPNLFWDGYRIFMISGDNEGKMALIIGFATVGEVHKSMLIEAVKRDYEENYMAFKMSDKAVYDSQSISLTTSMFGIYYADLDQDGRRMYERIFNDVREIIDEFSERPQDIRTSMALKSKISEQYPDLVSSVNRFRINYFREKHPAYSEPKFQERLKIWDDVDRRQ